MASRSTADTRCVVPLRHFLERHFIWLFSHGKHCKIVTTIKLFTVKVSIFEESKGETDLQCYLLEVL